MASQREVRSLLALCRPICPDGWRVRKCLRSESWSRKTLPRSIAQRHGDDVSGVVVLAAHVPAPDVGAIDQVRHRPFRQLGSAVAPVTGDAFQEVHDRGASTGPTRDGHGPRRPVCSLSFQSVCQCCIVVNVEFPYRAIGEFRLHNELAPHRLDDREECADDQTGDVLLLQA